MEQLTLLLEAPPAKTSPLQDNEQDWTENVATSPLSLSDFLMKCVQSGLCGRTCLDSLALIPAERLGESSVQWRNAGMVSATECWTLSISEFHKDAVGSSLSDILEIGNLPHKYYLSAQACRGILRRAERRGKSLPLSLQAALEQAAQVGRD